MQSAPLQRNAGFTLIELLVVLIIIGTLAGFAVLSMSGSDERQWSSEVERLTGLLQLVADRSVIDKAHYGVVLDREAYEVVAYDEGTRTWVPLESLSRGTGSARFVRHTLPENVRLEVVSEASIPSSQSTSFGEEEREEERIPHFVSLSSGEVLPVEVDMELYGQGRAIRTARISYSGLAGLKLEWNPDEY